MIRVLHFTNAYPYEEVPEYGVFVKEQIDSINRSADGVFCDVLFVNGRKYGKRAYLDGLGELRRRARDFDVLHCHHLYSAFVASMAMTGKPAVLSFQNDWLHEVEGLRSDALRRLACGFGVWWAKKVIFKSPIPAQFRGDDKFVHLPNGANANQFYVKPRAESRQALGLDPDATYLLFVSSKDRDRPQKRYDRFRQVLERARAAAPDRRIEELVMVNQPRQKVIDFFNAADLHLLASDFEGSPNSVKEALCCGLPVVATDVGNVREMVEGVPFCAVAATTDLDGLTAGVLASIAGPVDRESVRDGFLRKGLSQEMAAKTLVGIYTALASSAEARA